MKYMIILLAAMAISPASHALEIETTLAPAAWSYKESMAKTTGYTASTPLASSAGGLAALFELRLQQSFLKNWQLGVTGEILRSIGERNELWFTPNNTQQNALSIQHQEVRVNLLYNLHDFLPRFSLGGWLAWQKDVQKRRAFFVNGLAVSAARVGTVRETIQASWLGLTALGTSEDRHFRLRLNAGMPLSVQTTNNALPGMTFNKKQGFRWTVAADYELFTHATGASTRLIISYRFRQLGNEVQQAALWPKNKWRVLSLGVRQTW
ncbi:MAG: hypothetical protein Q9M22_00135 [Mariprofundaceae bacterium]|nr:hypothetical protein [Mariprofundaceae bacterium]